MLADALSQVAAGFPSNRKMSFAGNELADYIRNGLPAAAFAALPGDFDDLLIKGSPGQGNWAAVPWLGFFDPLVTESAMAGYYVVYLFDAEMEHLHLSMNQGTTAVYHEFGPRYGRDVLRERAETMRLRVADRAGSFSPQAIDLKSDNSLALGYEAGHALGRSYKLSSLPPDGILTKDLGALLQLYRVLTHRGGITPSDVLLKTGGVKNIEEARRYGVVRRLERNRKVRGLVLKHRKPICEACGLDPAAHYGFGSTVAPERMPVDVHHLAPISTIEEGKRVAYVVPDDFAVLCPTCHRVAHMLADPGDVGQLRKHIRFLHLTEL